MLNRIEHDSGILELNMARAPVNALNLELLTALKEAVEAAPSQGAQALVLSGSPNVFSAGLDLIWLLQQDEATLRKCWETFFGCCRAFATSPLISVAAITGHSPAGGAVIAIHCDYRVMAKSGDKPFTLGLNEVQVGLIVPEAIQYTLQRLVGMRVAERLCVAGKMVSSEEAVAIGMVDELADADQVVARSVQWLRGQLALPGYAMRETRRMARADLVEAITDPSKMDISRFIGVWNREDTQAALRATVARFTGKK